jgi:hypothetical protein
VQESIDICKAAGYDLIIVETSGIGQSDTEITEHSDVALYVMTSEYGAATQLEKIDMLDFADLIAINKFDKPGSLDALRDVKKQYRRNHQLWEAAEDDLPVYGTIGQPVQRPGMNTLFRRVREKIAFKTDNGQWTVEKYKHALSSSNDEGRTTITNLPSSPRPGTLPLRDQGEQRAIQPVRGRAKYAGAAVVPVAGHHWTPAFPHRHGTTRNPAGRPDRNRDCDPARSRRTRLLEGTGGPVRAD